MLEKDLKDSLLVEQDEQIFLLEVESQTKDSVINYQKSIIENDVEIIAHKDSIIKRQTDKNEIELNLERDKTTEQKRKKNTWKAIAIGTVVLKIISLFLL